MTYYGRAVNEHVDLTMAVLVEGIPYAFVERTVAGSPAAIGSRTQVVCVTRVEEGESELSYDDRRETAATLDVELLDTADNLLRTLLAAGTRATTWITADDTAAGSTIDVNSTSTFTAGGYVYIGAETLFIDTINTAVEADVARGQFGSTAAPINGTASDGDAVYLVPPFWRGRRVSLYGYTPQGDETLLGTFIIDESPRHNGDRAWSIRCAGIVQEYFERSVGVGLREVVVTDATRSGHTSVTLTVADATAFRLGTSFPTYAIVAGDDAAMISEVTAVDTGARTVTIKDEPSFNTVNVFRRQLDHFTVRPLAVVGGDSPLALLYVLLSATGQNVTAYDRLPGRDAASTYDPGWRLGAGFSTTEIDTAAFLLTTAIPSMTMTIGEERKVTEVLREWCILTGTAIVSTVDGKLKPITMAAQRTANTTAIGANDIVPEGKVEVEHDESGVFPLLTIRTGYDPIGGSTTREINLIDTELAKRYRRTPQRREVEIRSIGIGRPLPSNIALRTWLNPSSVSTGQMIGLLSDLMRGDGALARRFVRLSLTHEHLDLRIGDLVMLSSDLQDAFDGLPDMRGGVIGGSTCRVVSRRPRYDQGRVDVRLEILDRLLHVCPAAVIDAVGVVGAGANGGTVVTLATAGPELVSASPTAEWWVGAFVKIVDRSQGGGAGAPFFASVLALTTGTTMELSSVPVVGVDGWAIEPAVDYLTLDPDNSADGTSGTGYSLIEAAMLAGDDGVAGTNPDATLDPRWR